jgi:6-pyruvoyl-tetrahydropterin synthase
MRLFVDNLTNVDFSYLCPERGLLGETWLAHIELTGPLDSQGMVCDFGIVKKQLRDWLDFELDHRLLVPSGYSGCMLTRIDGRTRVEFALRQAAHQELLAISSLSPDCAIAEIKVNDITPASVANWCEQQLEGCFGAGVAKVNLRFTPEEIDTPYYQYSHGLKKHSGNCQRIAHGHRSKILIWRNGQLDLGLCSQWASLLKGSYIATHADISAEDGQHWLFKYQANQGEFELSVPKKQCYLIATDTTVEFIAQHIADSLKQQEPTANFSVKAFEGIGKGAIALS